MRNYGYGYQRMAHDLLWRHSLEGEHDTRHDSGTSHSKDVELGTVCGAGVCGNGWLHACSRVGLHRCNGCGLRCYRSNCVRCLNSD